MSKQTFNELTRFVFSQNSDSSSKTSADTQNPSEGSEKSEECSAAVKTAGDSSTPKKRLILSLSDKEKLLNWDVLVTPEDAPINTNTNSIHQHKDQVELVIY